MINKDDLKEKEKIAAEYIEKYPDEVCEYVESELKTACIFDVSENGSDEEERLNDYLDWVKDKYENGSLMQLLSEVKITGKDNDIQSSFDDNVYTVDPGGYYAKFQGYDSVKDAVLDELESADDIDNFNEYMKKFEKEIDQNYSKMFSSDDKEVDL